MQLKIDNRSPVYLQVIQYFKEQIASKQMERGEVLPSRRELANKLRINPNTVQRAYKEMEEMGLIYTDGNMPSKITQDKATIKQVRDHLVTDAVTSFVTAVQALHMPLEEIIPMIEQSYEEGCEVK